MRPAPPLPMGLEMLALNSADSILIQLQFGLPDRYDRKYASEVKDSR